MWTDNQKNWDMAYSACAATLGVSQANKLVNLYAQAAGALETME